MNRKVNQTTPRTITRSTIIETATKAEVDQESLKDRLMEVLRRESFNLLSESSEGVLARDRSAALIGYLKFLNQLEESQQEKLSELSDEELNKKSKE
jgi:hypothetical protein